MPRGNRPSLGTQAIAGLSTEPVSRSRDFFRTVAKLAIQAADEALPGAATLGHRVSQLEEAVRQLRMEVNALAGTHAEGRQMPTGE